MKIKEKITSFINRRFNKKVESLENNEYLKESDDEINKLKGKDYFTKIKNKLLIFTPKSLEKSNKNHEFTKYEERLGKSLLKSKNKYKKKKRKEKEKKGKMGTIKNNMYNNSSLNLEKKSKKDFEKFVKVADKMIKKDYDRYTAEIYKDNFLASIKTLFEGSIYESELKELISQTSAQLLVDMYYNDDDLDLSFYYYDDTFSVQERAEKIYNGLIDYLKSVDKLPKGYIPLNERS